MSAQTTHYVFDKYKQLILEFIWDKEQHKIRYNKLLQSYKDIGLKLIDLETHEQAAKIAWVIRAHHMMVEYCPAYSQLPIKNADIWLCNIQSVDIVNVMQEKLLSTQIWPAWAKLNYMHPVSKNDILKQTLWYNSNIKRARKVWFVPDCYEQGIFQIRDIYSKGLKRFFNLAELQNKYDCPINFLGYQGLISAIPAVWKQILSHGNQNEDSLSVFEKMPNTKKIVLFCLFRNDTKIKI